MGTTNVPVLPSTSPRELKMHDCLIEVTRFEGDQSAVFWLGGYLDDKTRINADGTFDHTMLSYDDFEQDLMDHLSYDSHEDDLRWDHNSPSQPRVNSEEPPAYSVRTYNTWVAALFAMQYACSGLVNSGVQPTATASSPIMTARFTIV
ncbi:hypothetical protein PEX1_087480 [Penicillium expansum]|uniref:Uncharacterized protein n=1 Tax=Penicillium expansum TaxID=27334 RepID=A0A0A2J6N4_PENEN|nr:hypothetical protein PEX2_027440 [Penicillium expansum]KGO46187.1 hypothetical protein PEX1_087480 [Penicillium expansum]KGO50421.1 hypothetical protein PEX2_027440 [Penicillium expansum]